MPTKLSDPTPGERETVLRMRKAIRQAIKKRELTPAQVAERLGLLPLGYEILEHKTWSLEVALRVAEALEVPIKLDVGDAEGS